MYGILKDNEVIAKFSTPLSVISNRPVLMTDALSLKRNVSKRPAHRWEITSNLEPLSYSANELFALFVSKGTFETIEVIMPQNFGVLMERTSTSNCTATGVAGATSVTITSNSGKIPAGTFVRFGSSALHTKVYMVKATLNGNGVLQIYPELRAIVSEGTRMYHRDDVIMPCLLDTDTASGMTYTDGVLMDMGTIKLVEKL
jgi:hypothetical protein